MSDIWIPFSDAMVLALFRGDKTQTRRARGLKEINKSPDKWTFVELRTDLGYPASCGHLWAGFRHADNPDGASLIYVKCPYGVPGDTMRVKEGLVCKTHAIWYAADNDPVTRDHRLVPWPWKVKRLASIFMPHRYNRIKRTITEIRCQRLKDITEEDALAEGIVVKFPPEEQQPASAAFRYFDLWDSINGPGASEKNPWLWAVTWERSQ